METYDTIGKWALEQFGRGKPLACYAKLGEEFGEIARPLQKQQYDKALLEMADMVIVLSHLVASLGMDLQRAVDEKMRVNRARTWERTPEGTYLHTNNPTTTSETRTTEMNNDGQTQV